LLRDKITEMKVLIFEGIATSGKSTIISSLQKALPDSRVAVAGESETHIPIMQETTDKHIEFFKELIQKHVTERPDVLIFDRLYLTQAFRAKCSINDYAGIEELLSKYSSITIFLRVDESAIASRISKAAEHRGSDYFASRGESSEEIAQYYIDQQRNQLKLLEQSKLPYVIINTTEHDYEKVIKEVYTLVDEK
jgi:thymidylate kinase